MRGTTVLIGVKFPFCATPELIVFKPIDEKIGSVSKFFQVDSVENKTIRSIEVYEDGGIKEIKHFKNQFLC